MSLAEQIKGDLEQAIQNFDKAIELDPRRSVLLIYESEYLRNAKAYAKAQASLLSYLSRTPQPPIPLKACAMRQLARVYRDQGIPDLADNIQQQAQNTDPVILNNIRWINTDEMLTPPCN